MGVDLALQGIQFTFSSFILLPDDLIHQLFDLLIGLLYRMSQMADLGGTADIDIRLSSCLVGLDGSIQLPDRLGYLPGYQLVSLQKHDQKNQNRGKYIVAEVLIVCRLHALRHNTDHLPACIGYAADDHGLVLTAGTDLVGSVLVFCRVQTVFFK